MDPIHVQLCLFRDFNTLVYAIKKRKIDFLNKTFTTYNALCKLLVSTASSEMIIQRSAT